MNNEIFSKAMESEEFSEEQFYKKTNDFGAYHFKASDILEDIDVSKCDFNKELQVENKYYVKVSWDHLLSGEEKHVVNLVYKRLHEKIPFLKKYNVKIYFTSDEIQPEVQDWHNDYFKVQNRENMDEIFSIVVYFDDSGYLLIHPYVEENFDENIIDELIYTIKLNKFDVCFIKHEPYLIHCAIPEKTKRRTIIYICYKDKI